jgi:hypothetical protein
LKNPVSLLDNLMSLSEQTAGAGSTRIQSHLNNRANQMKLTEQTQHKLAVLINLVKYLEEMMYREGVSNEEWNSCYEANQDIKETIFSVLRASIDKP